MTHDEFNQLVARLEDYSKQNPAGYKSRVFGLAMLGYGYVFLILFGLLAICVVFAVMMSYGKGVLLLKQLVVPFVLLAIVVIRAMWIRMPPPEGRKITAKGFPELFKVLKKIRKKLGGPRIHTVLLDDEFNAAIMQVPRLGILGWQKNYLIIGLPMMQGLSPKEFVSIIGHEYGHLAGSHGKFSSWIYRIRKTWFNIMKTIDEEERWGKAVFQKFFDWYAPYFSAYSFVLARSDEYDADRAAADITSPELAASALTVMHVKGSLYDNNFWGDVYSNVEKEPQPSMKPFVAANQFLRQDLKTTDANELLQQIMQIETGVDDTHPCLKDRLTALGQEPSLNDQLKISAADFFLGDKLEQITNDFSEEWQQNVSENWNGRHEYIKESRARILELEAKNEAELTSDENYELARLYDEFEPDKDDTPPLERTLQGNPEHVGANYSLGINYLRQGNDQGITLLNKAMELSPNVITSACENIYYYLLDHDREAEAEPYKEKYNARVEHEQEIENERAVLNFNDEYIPSTASEEEVADLVNQMKKFKRIGKVYLARKNTKLSDEPLYVIGIRYVWWLPHDEEDNRKFNKRMSEEIDFPYECFFVVMSYDNKPLKKVLEKVESSLIYKR